MIQNEKRRTHELDINIKFKATEGIKFNGEGK